MSLPADAAHLAELVTTTSASVAGAIREFYGRMQPVTSRDVLNEAATVLLEHATGNCPIEREVNLYVVSGALIEHGADPETGWNHLHLRLRRCFTVLVGNLDLLVNRGVDLETGEASEDLEPELRGWVRAFRSLVVAAMARLARRPGLRRLARDVDQGFADLAWQVQATLPSMHGFYLTEVLDVFDGQLLVVDVISQTMETFDVEGVRGCAHLITLLDGADARQLVEEPAAMHEVKYHYASFGCLDEEVTGLFKRTARLKDADWMFMLGVEVGAWNIPMLDLPEYGPTRIVVRAPKRFGSRSFRPADFFAPIHEALVERMVPVRSMTASEQQATTSALLREARALRRRLGRTPGAGPFPPELMQHPAWTAHWNPPHR